MRSAYLYIAVFVASTGCKREEPTSTPATTPEVARAPDGSRMMEPSSEISPILKRLDWEAQHRPPGGIKTEAVFAALERAEVRLKRTRQYLGATVNASYCAGGITDQGLAISVCEYTSEEAAADGMTFMEKRFAALTPHARRHVRGQTLLTIAAPSGSTDAADRAVETFSSL